jgi:hypothetical protein
VTQLLLFDSDPHGGNRILTQHFSVNPQLYMAISGELVCGTSIADLLYFISRKKHSIVLSDVKRRIEQCCGR